MKTTEDYLLITIILFFIIIIVNLFCVCVCRAVPKRLKDKLVSYILVLALIIDEFTLECKVLMEDLGMSESR